MLSIDQLTLEQVLAALLIQEQMLTDGLVEDSFEEALDYDVTGYGIGDDISFEEVLVLDENYNEIMDLCELVAAVEEGFII
jgi:hypothetical protein